MDDIFNFKRKSKIGPSDSLLATGRRGVLIVQIYLLSIRSTLNALLT